MGKIGGLPVVVFFWTCSIDAGCLLRLRGNSVTRVYVPRFFVWSQQRFGALRSWTNRVIALRQISVTALFYLEDSRRERERERKRKKERERERKWERERERKKRAHALGRERVREKALWLLLLYVFSSTSACPMQIGLSQECCLFCLKSSLWSSDLLLTFLVF